MKRVMTLVRGDGEEESAAVSVTVNATAMACAATSTSDRQWSGGNQLAIEGGAQAGGDMNVMPVGSETGRCAMKAGE